MMKRQKVHSLTGRIDMARMYQAWYAVKRNRGAAGLDKVSVQMYEHNLHQNLASLMYDLKHRGKYFAHILRRVYIPKGKGKRRPLGIPIVRDRVAQGVICALIEPIFEQYFSEYSFGFRKSRNAHMAIKAILIAKNQGFLWVVDADIQSFFDNIPHELIIDLIAEYVADGNILSIVREFLTAGVMEDGCIKRNERGTPQGGVISPLLANIVLNILDHKLAQNGFRFVRYADDFVIMCRTENSAKQALTLARDTLNKMGLSLSPEKTIITRFKEGFDFLGFNISSRRVSIRKKSMESIKDRIREKTIRSRNFGKEVIADLNRVIRGFANYFDTPFSSVKELLYRMDQWTRKRLRCMKYTRISKQDNRRFKNKYLARMGLVTLHYRHR